MRAPKANLPAAKKSRRVKIRLKREVRAAEIFLERRFGKAILLIAIEQFSEYSVGLAGSIMAANIGKSAVSAVSLVEFVMALFISVLLRSRRAEQSSPAVSGLKASRQRPKRRKSIALV